MSLLCFFVVWAANSTETERGGTDERARERGRGRGVLFRLEKKKGSVVFRLDIRWSNFGRYIFMYMHSFIHSKSQPAAQELQQNAHTIPNAVCSATANEIITSLKRHPTIAELTSLFNPRIIIVLYPFLSRVFSVPDAKNTILRRHRTTCKQRREQPVYIPVKKKGSLLLSCGIQYTLTLAAHTYVHTTNCSNDPECKRPHLVLVANTELWHTY